MRYPITVALSCLFFLSGCNISTNIDAEKLALNSKFYNTKDSSVITSKIDKNKDYSVLNSYGLSLNFMVNLKKYTSDKVLNKSEIKLLENDTESDSDKKFLNILKDKQSFVMSNLKDNTNEPDTLDFIINKNFDIDGNFLKTFYLSSKENFFTIKQLSDLSDKSTLEEKNYLSNLEKYDSYNILLLDQNENIKEQKLNLYYDESQEIPGNNISEIVANIGQSDRLDDTVTDNFRCGSAVILDAILLSKGINGFYNVSEKMGLHFNQLTYKNIHLAQDMLMQKVNSGDDGLSISYGDNSILFSGSFLKALTYSGVKWEKKLMRKENNSYKNETEKYFTDSPGSALVASVFFDKITNKLDFRKFPNHYILITFKDGKYYISNTASRNGTGSNTFEIIKEQLTYLFYSNNILIKISA